MCKSSQHTFLFHLEAEYIEIHFKIPRKFCIKFVTQTRETIPLIFWWWHWMKQYIHNYFPLNNIQFYWATKNTIMELHEDWTHEKCFSLIYTADLLQSYQLIIILFALVLTFIITNKTFSFMNYFVASQGNSLLHLKIKITFIKR